MKKCKEKYCSHDLGVGEKKMSLKWRAPRVKCTTQQSGAVHFTQVEGNELPHRADVQQEKKKSLEK